MEKQNLIENFVATFTNMEELWLKTDDGDSNFRDWQIVDNLSFQRKVLMEGVMDKLNWLLNSNRGAIKRRDEARSRVIMAQRSFTGDEISSQNLRAAISFAKAAANNVEVLEEQNRSFHLAYEELYGETYTPYGAVKNSNITVQDTPADIPEDIRKELEALGMAPEDNGTVSNTNGVFTSDEDCA